MKKLVHLERRRAARATAIAAVLVLGAAPTRAGSAKEADEAARAGRLHASHLRELIWRPIGPSLTSGRVADVAVPEGDPDTVYVATATGGLWKTVNHGTTWQPVFDSGKTPSLGAVAVAPSNPNVVWIGTGEPWSARSNSWGDGVYKSEDGGRSWQHMGLTATRHVGRIVIHPSNPDVVYVAGLGALWGANEERGLFKTDDGGKNWSKVLHISNHTGVADVALDPRNPDWLYAASFQRERRAWSYVAGGPEGAIFRSTDAGKSWTKLTNGLPRGDMGRIGLSVCASQPDTVYAVVEAMPAERGTYRSDDRGASWERRNPEVGTRAGYGQIRCDPIAPDRVYVLDVRTVVSNDGGRTFPVQLTGPGVHGDEHALWIQPKDSDHLILGTDGGLYFSYDRGRSWDFMEHLPVAQFYTVAVDLQAPFYYVYGGTQDNASYGGPSGTRNVDGITNHDWFKTMDGDGFYVAVDPTDSNVIYSEAHYGRLVRFDARTGERHLIQPQPPEGVAYRWNWSAPILISPHDHRTIYFAANKLFKSKDRGDAWDVISPDLTRQLDHFELPLQGKLWPRDAISLHAGTADYGNVSTLAESPLKPGLLAAGTDDGLLQVSRDDGGRWTKIAKFPGVPEQTYVGRVAWSRAQEGTLYATFDAHRDQDFRPFVLKSTDYGSSWTSITGDMPEGSTHVVVEHPRSPSLLFAGTEYGAFVTVNGGQNWVALKNNLPTVPVHDMVIHPRENDLVLGTHGRGFWILDDIAILEELTPESLRSPGRLARLRPSTQLHSFDRGRKNLGHRFFTAPNPPRGAIVSYWLNEGVAARLEILDGEGDLVRRLPAPAPRSGAGVARTVWDLRHELPYAAAGTGSGGETKTGTSFNVPYGPFVMPGEYQVRLTLGGEQHVQKVHVRADPAVVMSDADRRQWHDTLLKLTRLQATVRAVQSTAERAEQELRAAAARLRQAASVPEALVSQVKETVGEASAIAIEATPEAGLFGGTMVSRFRVVDHINMLYAYIEASTAPPTRDQQRLMRESTAKLNDLVTRLRRLVDDSLEDPDTVYVAALGSLWGPGDERGLFKTTDGGKTWTKSLFISRHTGVAEVAMGPRDPNWLYTSAFQRERRAWNIVGGGPEGALYRTRDGGTTWEKLENGLPRGEMGRIGISICRGRPDVVYAAVQAKGEEAGVYRSMDRGASWERQGGAVAAKIYCDPNDPERLYILRNDYNLSEDGGRSFARNLAGRGVHGDYHAFWIDPADSSHLILGTDGGVYFSYDRGQQWDFMDQIPVTQFYTVAVDMQEPFYNIYGGTQDNASFGGPSGTRHVDGITNHDWFMTIAGDGFYVAIDPSDPNVVYTEAHYGRIVRFDRSTGEQHLIQPQSPAPAPGAKAEAYRWNWNAPLVLSSHDSRKLYFAAHRVFRSGNRGGAWDVISPDLTRLLDQYELPLQGKQWPRDAIGLHGGTAEYGNISTLSESPFKAGLLAAGTDDGLIQVSRNDGGAWTRIALFPTVPDQTYVSRVVWSRFQEGTLYATFDGHRDDNFKPHVLKSTDHGASWTSITGNLPEGSVHVIVEHPRNARLLFVGTEYGVFVSTSGGAEWVELKNNLPTVPVHDMVIHPRENDLVIGTHGRGFWILDDVAILETLSREAFASPAHLAPLRPATQIHRYNRGRGNLGHRFFTAPNPPDGAVITYYLNPDSAGDQGEARLEILDAAGALVRVLNLPPGAGIRRAIWDLRHALPYPAEDGAVELPYPYPYWALPTSHFRGPFVFPGEYQVRLRAGGVERVQKVTVKEDPFIRIRADDRRVLHETLLALSRMQGAAHAAFQTASAMEKDLSQLLAAVRAHPEAADAAAEVESLASELEAALQELTPEAGLFGGTMPGRLRVVDQIHMMYAYVEGSTALPTQDQLRVTAESAERLKAQIQKLDRIKLHALPELYRRLDRLGVPWTPGRPVTGG